LLTPLQFEPVWPWPLTILACVAMFGILGLGYPRRIRHLSRGWRRLLLTLRLLVILLLLFMMLRPAIVMQLQNQSDTVLYVLLDSSRSMQTTDLPGGKSRRDAVLKTLTDAESSISQLKRRVEVRIRDFSDTLTAAQTPPAAADGKMTAFGSVLEQLRKDAGTSRVAGALILSDGKQAAAGSADSDPLQAARVSGRQQIPLYTTVYGSSESVDAGQDLALEELDLSRDVFQGNVVPIRVRLKSAGAQGQPVTVRVFLEDRTGVLPGQSGPMKPVSVSAESQSIVTHTPAATTEETILKLQVVPESIGELKLAVEADPLPGEIRRTNNRVETILRVRQGGIRVAYFDSPRWELTFLRKINVSSRVQIDFRPVMAGQLAAKNATRIRDEYFVPGAYDAYIIGNVPASAFQPQQLAALERCCVQGAGLMMTGGFNTLGAGGYDKSPLARLLPVELSDQDAHISDSIQMLPTRDGLSSFVMQIAAPDQNRARWEQLPPLQGANLLRRRDLSGAVVLAADAGGTPLLVSQSIGISRVLVFAGDTTWQWPLQGYTEEHQRFWRQVIFWLTKREIDSEQRVWINAEQRDLTPGQPASLVFGARDLQGNAITDAEFEVEVTSPSQTSHKLTTRKSGDGGAADFTDTLEPGDYWARVHATHQGTPVDADYSTRFHVNTRDPELDYPTADPGMLKELAHLSGGDFLSSDELLHRLNTWAEKGLPGMDLVRMQRITLWDNWFILGLLVALLTIEWAGRKRRGLV
jgi:hypothetical protein